MTNPDEFVAIEYAGHVTGVPARTLRRWASAGRVPVIAGQGKRLVCLADVRRLAEATGHRPANPAMTGGYTGHVAGYVAEEQAESIDVTAPAEIPPAARAQLAAIRDEFVAPLVQQIRELAEENGALKAERDALWSRLEQMEAERDVTVAQNDDPGATELAPPGPNALAAWWDRLMRLFAGG